jgi:SAM-dependent methyltransferase
MKGSQRERDLAREEYYSDAYFSYGQLWSFVEQIYYLREFKPQRVLEIGVGNGFVSSFLRSMQINVKTFDINPNLMPDVVASVHEITDYIKPGEFDLISCCEVLEHIPFGDFEKIIRMFSECSDNLFLTLPVSGRIIGFGGIVKFLKFQRWIGAWITLPFRKSRLPDMHFWEVNSQTETSKKEILKLLGKYYGEVETGLFKANAYHRYFKCRRSKTRASGTLN